MLVQSIPGRVRKYRKRSKSLEEIRKFLHISCLEKKKRVKSLSFNCLLLTATQEDYQDRAEGSTSLQQGSLFDTLIELSNQYFFEKFLAVFTVL